MKTVTWKVCALNVITVVIRRKEETSGMDMERRDINRLIKALESINGEVGKIRRMMSEERDIKDADIVYADGEPRMMHCGGKDYIITPVTEEDGEI